jgi:phage terminase large subunit-like protein
MRQAGAIDDQYAAQWLYNWQIVGRPKQQPPSGDWRVWLIMTGRGWGKTRTGAEWVRYQVEECGKRRIALVARTAADARDVMVEGESGLLSVCPPWNRPTYEPSKRRVTWPNGAMATTYTGDKPAQLRGPQHDAAWSDELAAWRYPETWDMLMFGLRLGERPQVVVTTTPRPVAHIKNLVSDPMTALVTGSTYENSANLPPVVLADLRRKYEGTHLGRQELEGLLVDDVPGALWRRAMIDNGRVEAAPDLVRIVVAIDPAVSTTEEANESGIVVAGVDDENQGYVLDDITLKGTPQEWASHAVTAYYKWNADRIIAEVNNGGDMIEHTVRMVDNTVSFKQVRASRGKQTRAEPVAALYEQGRVHHVGVFPEMEDQMCMWVPGDTSPDRMDAVVWALTELMLSGPAPHLQEQPEEASTWTQYADRNQRNGSRWRL